MTADSRAPLLSAGLIGIVAWLHCHEATAQPPRPLPGVKAEGQAKENKGKQTPPVKPDTVIEGASTRVRTRPPLVTLPVVPEFRQPTEQETAAAALGRIGRAAVPALIQTLGHRDPQVRRQAALVLARIGPDAADAVPELIELLGDADKDVRTAAARALGQIGPEASKAVPALMRQLVEPKPAVPRR
jgi:hypothetical protein